MDNRTRSRIRGTTFSAAAALLAVTLTTTAFAETAFTVNEIDIDQTTFDQYLQSRIQKPAAEATEAERANVKKELTDIYLLTTMQRAEELAKDEAIRAQIELQYRAVLAQAVVSDWLESNPATEAEIQEAYNAQTLLAPDLQYKARHILVETQSTAVDLISQLDGGADFQELAKENSTGPSGPSGGDLGWFASNQMVKPFSDAVIALENGAYTEAPVQTEFGWHVILREDSRNNEPPPLDSVRDTIKQNVEQTKFQNFLEDLRTSYEE